MRQGKDVSISNAAKCGYLSDTKHNRIGGEEQCSLTAAKTSWIRGMNGINTFSLRGGRLNRMKVYEGRDPLLQHRDLGQNPIHVFGIICADLASPDGPAMQLIPVMAAASVTMPSVNRKPATRSKSWPGVLMVPEID